MGLRAEFLKKRDEAKRHPPGHRGREKPAARPKSYSSSNAGVSDRAARDVEQRQAEERTGETVRSVDSSRLYVTLTGVCRLRCVWF